MRSPPTTTAPGHRAGRLGHGHRLAGGGVDPNQATLFIQSRVPEHAELHLLLSMMTPWAGWSVSPYKDQQEKLENKDLSTYGFLGYPLLQAADILIYRADKVPVGEDQVPHIEFSREIARRFNHLYGREPGFEDKARRRSRSSAARRPSSTKNCAPASSRRATRRRSEQATPCSTKSSTFPWRPGAPVRLPGRAPAR